MFFWLRTITSKISAKSFPDGGSLIRIYGQTPTATVFIVPAVYTCWSIRRRGGDEFLFSSLTHYSFIRCNTDRSIDPDRCVVYVRTTFDGSNSQRCVPPFPRRLQFVGRRIFNSEFQSSGAICQFR